MNINFVKKRLSQEPKNAKYTNKIIQSEILECLAGMVQDEIVNEVNSTEQFSFRVDETKDISRKE